MEKDLRLEIVGLSSMIGSVISIDEWAERFQIPDRYSSENLTGRRISEILGVNSKSWDPKLFGDPGSVTAVARGALESAALRPADIDAFFLVTCTPYELKLGQDGFRFSRELGLRDDVSPVQVEAGCGGLARVMNLAADLNATNILVLAYNVVSPLAEQDGPNPIYQRNEYHPMKHLLWTSPALFFDGAAAMVLHRTSQITGFCFYSRDQHSFGDSPGFEDPIVHFPGGGVLHPPGFPGSEELSCYAMSGPIIAEYYNRGMSLNHQTLCQRRPGLLDEVRQIYTHQAGPAMVANFVDLVGIPADKAPTSAAALGNLVSPCTLQLLHENVGRNRRRSSLQ